MSYCPSPDSPTATTATKMMDARASTNNEATELRMKEKATKSRQSMRRSITPQFYDASSSPAPLASIFCRNDNSSPVDVADFPGLPVLKPNKTVTFSRARPKKKLYYLGEESQWLSRSEVNQARKRRGQSALDWQTKNNSVLLRDAFYQPKLSDLVDFTAMEEEDNMRGNEHYVCAAHGHTRVKAKNRVIRSVLDRESDLNILKNKTPREVADELAALSLTLSDPATTFARLMGVADEVAAYGDDDDSSSSFCDEDPEILSDILSCCTSDDESCSEGQFESCDFHDCAEDHPVCPFESTTKSCRPVKPRAMRVMVPSRFIEKKLKKLGKSGSRRSKTKQGCLNK